MFKGEPSISNGIWQYRAGTASGPDFEVRVTTGGDGTQCAGEVWTAVWSRFPIVRDFEVSDPNRSVCVEVETPIGGLVVYGTVLPWLGDKRFEPLRGAAALASELAKQASDWRRIRAESSHCGFCVAGDFNQDLSETHYYGSAAGRVALRKTLQDNGLVCLTAGGLDRIHELTEGRCSAIDHICLGESWAPRFRGSSSVWPLECERTRSLSDHFGVWVELQSD